ncbi:P-loop containing nucleoside triphosphate hydrolase protein [Blyttiomyces helicus]|uniref:RNA helicase n=1 Tax=Blyttiomyces helicus TaxID=388810 RepID=A0A4V1IQ56_9FUNG|nr:P-loop containing nucleoside triphosphate hydrolase protein [Blyttiomyces helicus]|eukprot:RKO85387.1 P-loop containing nucleoside triphosphate hydrolase protein [Blyttiomyces helicus]
MGKPLGQEIGYSVRFEDCSDSTMTRVKYLTDGMLFRETLNDPLLTRYSVIMVDEAHERTMYTDLLLGVLKKILKKRPELRIVISSATLDAEAFRNFFNSNPSADPSQDTSVILALDGRTFPAVETCLNIHKLEAPGDVLIFLTGKDEIDTVVALIRERAGALKTAFKLQPMALYGGLALEEQREVFNPAPHGTRKVVVATNIAEASLTIDGIVYVIDAGFVKMRAYSPRTSISSLIVSPTSKASAIQRAGRAGRTRAGKAYRLYTKEAFDALADNSVPEMQRSDLSVVILQLKALGVENVLHFDFMSSPPVEIMTRALELLYSLKALDDYGRLSMPFGTHLAEFPIDPLLGTMLLNSFRFKCGEEALTIAAMMSVQNVFVTPSGQRVEAEEERRKFSVEEGDHITYVNVYNSFLTNKKSSKWCFSHFLNYKALTRALTIRQHLTRHLRRFSPEIESCGTDTVPLRKCIVSGFFSQAARLQPDGSYATIRENERMQVHPTSVLSRRSPSWVVFHEVVETTKVFMRELTVISPEWLTELAPHYYLRKEK